MSAEKKEKVKCEHHFVVTGWMIKGGMQNATQMRCAHCLVPKCLEELQSREWKEKEGF